MRTSGRTRRKFFLENGLHAGGVSSVGGGDESIDSILAAERTLGALQRAWLRASRANCCVLCYALCCALIEWKAESSAGNDSVLSDAFLFFSFIFYRVEILTDGLLLIRLSVRQSIGDHP